MKHFQHKPAVDSCGIFGEESYICQVSGLSQQNREEGYLSTNTHLLVEGFVLDRSHTWVEYFIATRGSLAAKSKQG